MRKIFPILLALVVFLTFTSSSFAINQSSYPEIVKEHNLTYPGLLPDSKFYFLKMIRDKAVGLLISDPIKKAEFDLLEADKRLNAGIFLLIKEKKDYSLAVSTISKGENYLADAVSKVKEARQQGIGVTGITARLNDSLIKHQQILKRLELKLSGEVKDQLRMEQRKLQQLQKGVEI